MRLLDNAPIFCMPIKTPKTVVFLLGPTTAGKTDLAIKLSQIINTRLISVDSALIYKGMDIGTAKPDANILARYPHHLIDICKPSEIYSAFNFCKDATAQIQKAFENEQIPILVGGTSFYFNALEYGLSNLPESTPRSKQKFNQLLETKGAPALHQDLAKIDKTAAERIHPNDSQRIIRALEVFDLSGKILSDLQGRKKLKTNYTIKKIILTPSRTKLHQRIEKRFLTMLDKGFLAEVKRLKQTPNLHKNLPAIRCVGYRQAWQYLDGEINKQQMIEKSIIATRQLCKRQSTWLKDQTNALLLKTSDPEKAIDFIQNTY